MRLFAFLAVAALAAAPAVAQNRIVVVTNGSGTVQTANQSQQVFARNDGRNYLFCQNPINATGTLYIDYDRPAVVNGGAIELAPGGSVSFLAAATPIATVNVTSATAGHRFICKQGGNN